MWIYYVKAPNAVGNPEWIPRLDRDKSRLTYRRDADEKQGWLTSGIYYASTEYDCDAYKGFKGDIDGGDLHES